MDIEPKRVVTDLPGLRPFDLAFRPVPSVKHTHIPPCPFTQIGFDVTITPPKGHTPPSRTSATSNNTSAVAAKHLLAKERGKLMREGKMDPYNNCFLSGEQIIEDLYNTNRVLIPLAVSPYGRWGPLFHSFLFDKLPHGSSVSDYKFSPTRRAAEKMFHRLRSHPTPNNIIGHATTQWKLHKPKRQLFYGHSHTAPTPKEYTLQKLGLVISNAIALHVRDAQFGQLVEPSHPNDEDFDCVMTDSADEPTLNSGDPSITAIPVDDEPASLRGGGASRMTHSLDRVHASRSELHEFDLDFLDATGLWHDGASSEPLLTPLAYTYSSRQTDQVLSGGPVGLYASWMDAPLPPPPADTHSHID